ncbi:hypothetical protein [Labedaea rhizosphaerae]|uniref:BNR/Asp-box repeat protein n=1 Tax=Labedaea rhizosphaerae TaxID=598644 RepID=A0A4R6S225_LABRH|nr:hypothetical protein [Labedaea rhizosphaerae]TDP93612.1 hypothetical protein EV186_1066 [Labedaea rhizosphaerae]
MKKILVVAAGLVLAACGTAQQTLPVANEGVAHQGNQLAKVTPDASGLVYEHSTDGGRTWQRSTLHLDLPTRQAVVALSPDGARAGVMATLPGSASTGGLPALFTGPAAGPLAARQAPVAGDVAWVGSRLVLVGGPQRSLVYSSPDGGVTWQKLDGGGRFNVPATAPSHGAPLTTADGVTVPVTAHGRPSTVRLDTSKDGVTFTKGVVVTLSGDAAPGVAVPVAVTGPDAYVVVDPSGVLHVVHATTQETITPSGLPGPIESLTFTDAQHGTAQVAHACTSKDGCDHTVTPMVTDDGGHTWR